MPGPDSEDRKVLESLPPRGGWIEIHNITVETA